ELITTGEPISAQRAFDLGLVNRVVPVEHVLDEALALAEKVAANAPISVRVSREVARRMDELTEDEGWALLDKLADEIRTGEDKMEGLGALAERREPVGKGR